MDESEYIGNWVETKTTLSEWLEHGNFDHWEVLNELGLSESQIENIENHQFSLFNKAVQNSVISMINSYQDVVKNIVFTEHLRILDLFLNSTKVEKFLIELLKPIVNIREQDYLGILKEYQNIIARKYNDFKTDFNICQKGSFLTGLHFTASIIFDYKSAIEKHLKALPPQPIKTKADILKEQLSQYGFFELEKVKTLSEQSKVSIIEKIAESGLPYAIAMFDYLQFIPYLEKKHFDSKYKLNREVSKWFDSDKEGRAVKGNISSLLKNTTENKDRYTAYKHKENVIKDYELLK